MSVSGHPPVCLSICPSVYLSVGQGVGCSGHLFVRPSVCLTRFKCLRLSVCPSVCLFVCLSVCLSVYPSVRPSFSQEVRVCPSVCPPGCMKAFNRPDKLKAHIITHSGVKPYRCADCGKVFSRRPHLAEHVRLHRRDYRYSCASCQRGFLRLALYRRHRCRDEPATAPLPPSAAPPADGTTRRHRVAPVRLITEDVDVRPKRGRPRKVARAMSAPRAEGTGGAEGAGSNVIVIEPRPAVMDAVTDAVSVATALKQEEYDAAVSALPAARIATLIVSDDVAAAAAATGDTYISTVDALGLQTSLASLSTGHQVAYMTSGSEGATGVAYLTELTAAGRPVTYLTTDQLAEYQGSTSVTLLTTGLSESHRPASSGHLVDH